MTIVWVAAARRRSGCVPGLFGRDGLGANNPSNVANVNFVAGKVGHGVRFGSGGSVTCRQPRTPQPADTRRAHEEEEKS